MRGWRNAGVFLLFAALGVDAGSAGEVPRLLADISSQIGPWDSPLVIAPSGFVEAGGRLLFSTADNRTSDEGILWSTDGTAEGTEVVSSLLCPAPCVSISPWLTWRGAAILKVTTQGHLSGLRLWRTDGTPAGTWPLTGGLSEGPRYLETLEHVTPPDAPFFYFVGCPYLGDGCTLWRSDGTRAGTMKVLNDISYPHSLTFWNGRLWFLASDSQHNPGLWSTDGTEEGTTFHAEALEAYEIPAPVVATPSRLFFASGETGEDLWVTDGTPEGARRLADFEPVRCSDCGCGTPDVNSLVAVGDAVYFVTHRNGHSSELWRSDGTESGTRPLLELPAGVVADKLEWLDGNWIFGASFGQPPVLWTADAELTHAEPLSGCDGGACPTFRGFLSKPDSATRFFAGESPGYGTEIWITDGTGAGTYRLSDACEGSCSGHDVYQESETILGSAAGKTYFRTNPSVDSGTFSLWVTDGTRAGTNSVPGDVSALGVLDGAVYFATAGSKTQPAAEIWSTDGTPAPAGIRRVTTLRTFAPGSYPSILPIPGGAMMMTTLEDHGEFRRSDGTPEGTSKVSQLDPSRTIFGSNFTRVGALHFFDVFHVKSGPPEVYLPELWRADGRAGGTRGVLALSRREFIDLKTPWNDKLLFMVSGPGGPNGCAFWSSDGTRAGTREILPDLPGVRCPTAVLGFGKRFLFVARVEGPLGPVPQIFVSDSTLEGTRQLSKVQDTRDPLSGDEPVIAGDTAFFRIWVRHHHNETEVWRTNGTPEGTRRAFKLRDPANLYGTKDSLYLTAAVGDPSNGVRGLFRVPVGGGDPVLLVAAAPYYDGPNYFQSLELTPAGGLLFFVAQDLEHGSELWVTDGTPAGTRLVDIRRGPASSGLSDLVSAGDRIFFAAQDGQHGRELWTSDGTPEGTRMVWDLNPSGYSSSPAGLTVSNGYLFFSADDGQTGVEPWSLRLGPP